MPKNRALEGKVHDMLTGSNTEIVHIVKHDDPLGIVIESMRKFDISQLPVTKDDVLLGLVNEVQVLDALLNGDAKMTTAVGKLATKDNIAEVSLDSDLDIVASIFVEGKIAIIMDENKIKGLLTKIDFIGHLAKRSR